MNPGEEETPLERYRRYIRSAEDLERLASDDATGGSSYFTRMNESTRFAIAGEDAQKTLVECGKAPERGYRLNAIQIQAIDWVCTEHFDPIWKAAAASLRAEAKRMREELVKQHTALVEVIKDIGAEAEP